MLPDYRTLYDAWMSRDTSVQEAVGTKPDGLWGPATESALLSALDEAWQKVCDEKGWVFLPVGRQVPRRPGPHLLIWHWPGSTRTARQLADSWTRNLGKSNVSSHCGLDENEYIWYAAPHMRTNHAPVPSGSSFPPGFFNARSIGIDICVPVLAVHARDARKRGVYVGESAASVLAPNGRRHNHAQLHLHPAMSTRALKLRKDLEDVMGPMYSTDHHHVDGNNKWDVRGQWENVLRRHGVLDPDDFTSLEAP